MEFPKQENLSPFKEGIIGKKKADGTFSNVYEMNDLDGKPTDKIIKIGKAMEEFTPPLLNDVLKIKFPREKLNTLLVKLLGEQFQIYPDKEFVMKGVFEHLLMKKYFGYGENSETFDQQDDRNKILESLKDSSSYFFQEISSVVGVDFMNEIARAFEENKEYNFLPSEQTVIGHPPNLSQEEVLKIRSEGKKLPVVHYIIQEEISGSEVMPLSEVGEGDLKNHQKIVERLITFLILIKKMYEDTGKLIDTRPEEIARHPFEWFQNTANILIDKKTDKVSFVDTRLLWDKNSSIGTRGVNLIKHLGIKSIDRALKKYASILENK